MSSNNPNEPRLSIPGQDGLSVHARARRRNEDSAVPDEVGEAHEGGGELETIPQVARGLGVGVRQVRRAVKRGELASYQVGGWPRVRRSDVSRWLRTLRVEATPHARQRVAELLERTKAPRK